MLKLTRDYSRVHKGISDLKLLNETRSRVKTINLKSVDDGKQSLHAWRLFYKTKAAQFYMDFFVQNEHLHLLELQIASAFLIWTSPQRSDPSSSPVSPC